MAPSEEPGETAKDERIAALEAENAELRAVIAEQNAKIEALTKQVEVLTELLNRNSNNSHQPPSGDAPGSSPRSDRAARNKRKAERRKRGAQKGHRGSHRELLPAEQVDTFVHLFPEACLGCARPLPERWGGGPTASATRSWCESTTSRPAQRSPSTPSAPRPIATVDVA